MTKAGKARGEKDRSEEHDPSKEHLFLSLGYGADYEELNCCLIEAKLTTPGKLRINSRKRLLVAEILERQFVRVCRRGDCQARAADLDHRRPVQATNSASCEICGGSADTVARSAAVAACDKAGWHRLCIVGGSPATRTELERTRPPSLELRLVEGTTARPRSRARDDLRWADHVVLWGSTQLDHKVSRLYSDSKNCSALVRRSVQELWSHIARKAEQARIA